MMTMIIITINNDGCHQHYLLGGTKHQTSQTEVDSTMPATDETRKILPIFLVVLIDVLGLGCSPVSATAYYARRSPARSAAPWNATSRARCSGLINRSSRSRRSWRLASTFLIGHRLLAAWAWSPAAICMLDLWLCVRMPREAAVQMS
jgi:hypothetical protein